MDVKKIIKAAVKDGVTFRVDGDQLRIGTPTSKEQWQDKLNPHRDEILVYLSGQPSTEPPENAEPEGCVDVDTYQTFPIHTLPTPLADFVSATSKSLVCDESFVALPLFCGLASSVGATRALRITDTWTEPSVLWGAIVSTSGSQKSPAQQLALAPLEDAQAYYIEQEPELLKQYENDMKLYLLDFKKWNQKGRANGEPQPEEPLPPRTVRYVVDNTTIESLAGRLQENPRGLLVAADELSAWLGNMGRYANGATQGEKAQWLSFYRAGRLLHDRGRKIKETTYVKHAAVSICGGVPPKTFRKLIASDDMDNGMAARLLIAMPPKRAKRWSTARVSSRVKARVVHVYSRLLDLDFNDGNPIKIRLAPEALELAIHFVNQHGNDQLGLEDELQSAWSKMEAVAFRLAMLFALVRWAEGELPAMETGDVDLQDMVAAIELTEWFCNEWKRFFATFGETNEDRKLRKLAEWISHKGGSVNVREVQQGHRCYKTASEAEAVLNQLKRAGYGNWVHIPPSPKGGQPTRIFKLFTASTSTQPQKTRESEDSVDVDSVDTPETQSDSEWGEL